MLAAEEKKFLDKAIELSAKGMKEGHGGPFGCVVVRDNEIIGEGYNMVTSLNDPTAHAEIVAIRAACKRINSFQLTDCDIYTSCEPCPMCLGAIYWARPKRVIYANTKDEAAAIDFDDDFIYREISTQQRERKIPFIHFPHPGAREVFADWKSLSLKVKY